MGILQPHLRHCAATMNKYNGYFATLPVEIYEKLQRNYPVKIVNPIGRAKCPAIC
jgi:hypothetical protein